MARWHCDTYREELEPRAARPLRPGVVSLAADESTRHDRPSALRRLDWRTVRSTAALSHSLATGPWPREWNQWRDPLEEP